MLYADSSVKDAAQVAVKTARWAMVDSLEDVGYASAEGPSWASLSPFLKEAMAAWRQAPASAQATSPIVALAAQECSPAGKKAWQKACPRICQFFQLLQFLGFVLFDKLERVIRLLLGGG